MKTKDKIITGTDKRYCVYGLVNPRTGSIRYIGLSGNADERAREHKQKYPFLELRVIGYCDSDCEMAMWEFLFIEFWQPPLNIASGGRMSPMKNPEVAAKVAATKKRIFNESPKLREENARRVVEWRKNNPDKHPMKCPKARAKVSVAKTGQIPDESARRKMSETTKKFYADNPERHPMFGRKHTEESLRKMRDAARNRSAETRKRMSDAQKGKRASAETRRKMSEAHKRRAAKVGCV